MQLKKELGEWFGNARGDILAGLVSSFAVIPEVVGFCIVAGINLYFFQFGAKNAVPSLLN